MPQCGEILYYPNYTFADGRKADKLFVILNIGDINSPCLVLKTTSQSVRYKGVKQGCNPKEKVFFVPAAWGNCFEFNTYIQLPEIIEISMTKLSKGASTKEIRVVNSLPSNCFAQLKNCLKYFRDDIIQQHWKLIFG